MVQKEPVMRPFTILMTLMPAAAFAQGQQNPAPAPSFEVATIKPAAPDARGVYIRPGPGGGLSITNMTVKDMIVWAWRIQPFQVSGGPSWLDSVHYDVVARPEAKAGFGEMQTMLQALLAERFQLRVHNDTKDLPIYALILARKDGKLGPDLLESPEGSCQKFDPTHPPPPPQPGASPPRYCGQMMIGPGGLTMVGQPISELLPLLSRMTERKVVDQTALKGKYDINLQFPRDEAPPSPDNPVRPDFAAALFSAFPERLGLKFESQKGPVEVIVVDKAEKPSDN
jgi:uncharacterized protein (TIGR03435 family)